MPQDPSEEYQYKEKIKFNPLDLSSDEGVKINCPSCSQTIPADNLNIQTNIGKCGSCDVLFSFSKAVSQMKGEQEVLEEVLKPKGVDLNHYDGAIEISVQQPWSIIEIMFISFFPLIILVLTGLFTEFIPATSYTKFWLAAFLVAALTAYISYFFIRKEHRISVHIDDSYLYIERRPKKLIKDKAYPIEEINQIYTKNTTPGSSGLGIAVFMIINGKDGQQHIELIKSVNSRSKAKYIEQEIERQLGIQDRRVPDEES